MSPPKTKAPPQRLRIVLSKLEAMPGNREFGSGSGKALNELAASIKEHGVKQDLLVRPHPTKKGHFQIVFGCRRRDASELAKVPDAPCMVEDLTDAEAMELRLIENVQRAGIHEMEEARGYQQLLDLRDAAGKAIHTRISIAEKIGKSEAYVYARLKLLRMPDVAQDAFLKGKLNASVALLLCRIPDTKVAYKATLEVLDCYGSGITPDREKRALDPEVEPLSYRSAKSHIQQKYMIRLKGAKFDQEDETLVPAVYEKLPPPSANSKGEFVPSEKLEGERLCGGKCSDCPFRTGNLKKLAPDVLVMAEGGADVCTNTACYQLKVKATLKREHAKFKEKGQNLLTPGQSRKVLNYDGTQLAATDEYIDLRATVPGKKKTYEELLEPHLPEDATPTVARGKKNFLLLPIADAMAAAKKAGIKIEKPEPRNNHYDPEAERLKDQKRQKRREFAKTVINASYAELETALLKCKLEDLLRFAVNQSSESYKLPGHTAEELDEKVFLKLTEKMSIAELAAVIALNNFPEGYGWEGQFNESFVDLCKSFGVDVKAIIETKGKEAKAAEADEAAKAKETKPEPAEAKK